MKVTRLCDCDFKILNSAEVEDNIDEILFNLDFESILSACNHVGFVCHVDNPDIEIRDLKYQVKNMLVDCYSRLDRKLIVAIDTFNIITDKPAPESIKIQMAIGGFYYDVEYYFTPNTIGDADTPYRKKLYTEVNFVLAGWSNHD
jgi:hypothetical protein